MVNHGHVTVNDRKVDIPSFQVKAGDIVAVKADSQKNPHVEGAWSDGSWPRPSAVAELGEQGIVGYGFGSAEA